MNSEQTKEIIERLKTAQEFADDYKAYIKCCNLVKSFERVEAITLIQSLIERYHSQINQFGFFVDGVCVINGVNYNGMTDLQIKDQLVYIGQRIPVYAFIREGENKLANDLFNKIGNAGFIS